MVYSGEKPYMCDLCDYSAAQKRRLEEHKLKHSKEKPYKCSECDLRTYNW